MNFTLYIANYCSSCKRTQDFISLHNIPCVIVNLDDNPQQETPIPIMIFPALIKGDKLLAYGCDIAPYLKRILNI